MLLKLDKELKQTDTINYACLPKNRFDTPRPGDMCTIAGWGVHSMIFALDLSVLREKKFKSFLNE